MAARVMRVHAQIMPQPMRKERHARPLLKDLLLPTLQDPDTQQPLYRDLVRHSMHIVPQHSLRQHLSANLLHLQHDIVDLPTLLAKLPLDGKRPRDVRSIAPKLPTRIQ